MERNDREGRNWLHVLNEEAVGDGDGGRTQYKGLVWFDGRLFLSQTQPLSYGDARIGRTTFLFFLFFSFDILSYVVFAEAFCSKVLGQKFPYTQVQLPMMPSLNLLDPHNHNLESLSSWHTS